MGRGLLVAVKTILTTVIAGAMVIASFYSAYLILLLLVMGIVSSIAYLFYSWKDKVNWFDYKDFE